MAAESKDSPEVIEFMILFSRLKDWCDDRPDELVDTALRDSSVAELCLHLSSAAVHLEANELRRRFLFTAPVDPKFLAAFRDYEERFAHILVHLALCDLVGTDASIEVPKKTDRQRERDYADSNASSQAAAIHSAIEFAQSQIKAERDHDYLPEGFADEIEDGTAAWERLCQDTGFDLRGVFRRRALIPLVLVPRHIAAKHGSAEKLSLFSNLGQAHDAFVFGTPFAVLALMRSVMETIFRYHVRYHDSAEGKTLDQLMKNARQCKLLPRTDWDSLFKLKSLSNDILHMNKERGGDLTQLTERLLEDKILLFMLALRNLIEGLQ